jgi:hypothetical protein
VKSIYSTKQNSSCYVQNVDQNWIPFWRRIQIASITLDFYHSPLYMGHRTSNCCLPMRLINWNVCRLMLLKFCPGPSLVVESRDECNEQLLLGFCKTAMRTRASELYISGVRTHVQRWRKLTSSVIPFLLGFFLSAVNTRLQRRLRFRGWLHGEFHCYPGLSFIPVSA